MSSLARTLAAQTVTYQPVRFIAEVYRGRQTIRIPRCHAGACHAVGVAFGPSGPLCWPCHDWLRRYMETLMKRKDEER